MKLLQKSEGVVTLHTALLLFNCLILLFVIPLFPRVMQPFLYYGFNTFLLLTCASMVEHKNRNYLITGIIISVALTIARFFNLKQAEALAGICALLFFIAISLVIIKQILLKKPGLEMILQAIGGFLLFGIGLVFVMDAIETFNPGSFVHVNEKVGFDTALFSEFSYFVFITYTTVGYGDIIPTNDIAKTFAKFIAISGQIYNSVVIALLIGKYINHKSNAN